MSGVAAPSEARRLRSIVGGSIGNLVEWYDWYVYSAFALYFAPSFFPNGDQTAQLLNSAAVFALGFLMRPVGGWVMGRYADRRGRRAALSLSVLLMCSGSLLIAATPSHAAIGLAAPLLLVLARLLQGLSVGGEYGASATYLSEMAGRRHRGFYSSFQYVTLIGGQLIALAVLLVLQRQLSAAALEQWGWRVPFAIGGALAVGALWLRRGLDETTSFEAVRAERTTRGGAVRELLRYPREIATVVGLTAGGTVAFYTFTTYAQKFLVNTAGFSKAAATEVSALALLVFMVVQPVVGGLSDRVGRRPVLMTFGVLGTLGTVPLLDALGAARTESAAFALLMVALLAVSGYTSINAVVKAELFPTSIRALGVALPYAIAVSVFGGTAEYLALWAKSIGHERWFYWYVTVCVAGSLVVYATMPETRTTSRIVED
ncbi:MAG: MFS transporter [Gemmatimonadaceae bacterium]|nr:MFS transporter [Gemmatimonadaceae bacterium]NUO95061.1 MFS transporter [Gemmatimonadaceae bacterium]NUP72349.1 MFS transporter [Gemmatimonadaceae bacterium]NUR36081.1 MFS transporter [Gemmatimonadaceae bacterium]NUS33827.1 MFS transporter [Gemmatimonadaceae bacterium]